MAETAMQCLKKSTTNGEAMLRRQTRMRLSALCVLIALTSCRSDNAEVKFESILVENETREYRVVIPDDKTKFNRVVIAFHGTGDTAESMAEYSRLDELAIENGFVIVYPQANNGMWKSVNLTTENASENPDVEFFEVLVSSLRRRLSLQSTSVDLVGMSNGAEFSLALGTLRPSLVNSIVAHSAGFSLSLDTPEPHIPILFVVGENDSRRLAVEKQAEECQQKGDSVKLVVIPRLGHEWSRKSNKEIGSFLHSH